MSLDPFWSAPLSIQIHAVAATLAVAVGPLPLYRKRRDRVHKAAGYIWAVSMLTVAVTAFFIHSFPVIGPFSPLHGFAILTFWSLWRGITAARRGDINIHQATFRNLYWSGLILAGLANFMPGRRTNEAVFGGNDRMGWVVIVVGVVIVFLVVRAGRTGDNTGSSNRSGVGDSVAAK